MQCYQLANLESARQIINEQANLLTVRGVSIFCEQGLKQKIESKQETALYDPNDHDLKCLGKVLMALVHLDVFTTQ